MKFFVKRGLRLQAPCSIPVFILIVLFASFSAGRAQVKTGADLLLTKYFHLIKGKSVGLVTNHTGVLSTGEHLADALHRNGNVRLMALFGPEHGVRGSSPAGEKLSHGKDAGTGVAVFSLYGETYKPTGEMLQGIDILLFDIQDVGARFYTYISTLSYAMEAAAERGIPFVVLDRPNPIRGTWVEGFVRDDSLRSFVGLHPVPIAHGMTVGELATMFNGEAWLKDGIRANLVVVKMEGWKREMWYDETGLPWIPPSPNIKTLSSATVYPGTCLMEGTNLSEGRGTEKPFEFITAPFMDGNVLAARMNALNLPGVVFEPIEVVPKAIAGVVTNPKHKDTMCRGVFLRITERDRYKPVGTAVSLLQAIRELYPAEFQWRQRSIDVLAGTPRLRMAVDGGRDAEMIVASWEAELRRFENMRKPYLLY